MGDRETGDRIAGRAGNRKTGREMEDGTQGDGRCRDRNRDTGRL